MTRYSVVSFGRYQKMGFSGLLYAVFQPVHLKVLAVHHLDGHAHIGVDVLQQPFGDLWKPQATATQWYHAEAEAAGNLLDCRVLVVGRHGVRPKDVRRLGRVVQRSDRVAHVEDHTYVGRVDALDQVAQFLDAEIEVGGWRSC